MLPPPITIPIPTPMFTTARTSSQNCPTLSKSKPVPFSPASASPESLIRIRLSAACPSRVMRLLAHPVAYDPLQGERCACGLRRVVDQLLAGLRHVADSRLLEVRHFGEELPD